MSITGDGAIQTHPIPVISVKLSFTYDTALRIVSKGEFYYILLSIYSVESFLF